MLRTLYFGAILVLAVAAISITSPVPPALAQAPAQTEPQSPPPSRVQKIKEKTKETWAQMKRRWSLQREKYADCTGKARQQKLSGHKQMEFLEDCMTH